jgi:hypothetical protein
MSSMLYATRPHEEQELNSHQNHRLAKLNELSYQASYSNRDRTRHSSLSCQIRPQAPVTHSRHLDLDRPPALGLT